VSVHRRRAAPRRLHGRLVVAQQSPTLRPVFPLPANEGRLRMRQLGPAERPPPSPTARLTRSRRRLPAAVRGRRRWRDWSGERLDTDEIVP
jgi:hypothetical protein